MFKKVHRETTLSGMVSDQIQRLIVESQLQPGDRLPAERDLAIQFGVSRTVVREAVRGLAAKGLLKVSPGRGGTTVRRPTADAVTQSMALYLRAGRRSPEYENLIEVRRTLEVEIAGLAAQRRNEDDLAHLRENLAETERVLEDRENFVQLDLAFHALLAKSTQNDLWILLLDTLTDLMQDGRRLGYTVSGTAKRAFEHHKNIFTQIDRGNADSARDAMRSHLTEAHETWRKATALMMTQPLGADNGKV